MVARLAEPPRLRAGPGRRESQECWNISMSFQSSAGGKAETELLVKERSPNR